ncbi:hypothetical protein DFH07DRAFT_207283 [Mycena maculata]|uniref:PHD-type domain-containing protein n=1 Tax=Mycena maculata TaxID=230809 RepID=A0AAD7P1G1_9AGAR|nr:hypothetical protein DFH07DRAFT_207283 [Mycena maculata]
MSRRLDISSLLCDEPPPKELPRLRDEVIVEPVLLAPHLRTNSKYAEHPHQSPEQSLDTLARAAALAEKQRDPPFSRDPRILRSPVEDLHRPRTVNHFSPRPPQPARYILEQQQQQQQQHQHHLFLVQQQKQQQLIQQQQQEVRQREREQHQMQERLQAHHLWERGRVDAMAMPPIMDLRPGRKSDPGQLRPLSSPVPHPTPSFPAHIAHMEPPSKKRRYSDSPGPLPPVSNNVFEAPRGISLSRSGGDRSILNADPPPAIPIRRPTPSSGHDAAQAQFSFSHRPVLERHGIGGQTGSSSRIQSPAFPTERRSPPGSASGRAKAARKSEPEEPDVSPYPTERRDYTVIHVPERPRDEYAPEDRKHKKSQSQSQSHSPRSIEYTQVAGPSRRPEQQQQQDTRQHGPPQRRPQPQPQPQPATRQPKEEDAHEWLLEHFADPSPEARARQKPETPMSPSPLPAMPHVFTSQNAAHTKRVTPPLVPATMPEAAVALEEELASVFVPAPSKVEDVDMDVDMAVSELVETMEIRKVEDGGMEVDVEDELLSLVDDRPRSRSTTIPPSVSRVPSGGNTKHALHFQSESSSRHASPMAASSPSSFVSPNARASSMLPPSERGSMPPPASIATGQSKSKETSASKKKKETAKPAPKPKAPLAAKPRARPAPKPKVKTSDGPAGTAAKAKAPSAISRKSGSVAASASRSRSTSVMPGGSVGPDSSEKHEEEEEDPLAAAAEDDKLYCVCKTKYDEDRFMIACDKCDEWYHTQCVDMPDLVVDLVDQFFCPVCIEKNPNLSLKTTYKPRCRYGLDHPEPDSPKACHKPAQGAFSKYCSPECGLNNIKKRIETFAKNGGKKELLWDSVKDAQKREAVVIVHEETATTESADGCTKENADGAPPAVSARVKPSAMGKVEREVANLNAVLDEVVTLSEDLKEGLEIVFWRERLLDLARDRAEQVGQCGWDQRLCFGEDEWAEFGAGVLESYDEKEGAMQVDGEEWWCLDSDRCTRHAGWQAIRERDIAKEREKKEEALFRLTTRERELRKRIEDIVEPFNRSCIDPSSTAPLKSSKLVNGNPKGKANGDNKKGKKRKNPS